MNAMNSKIAALIFLATCLGNVTGYGRLLGVLRQCPDGYCANGLVMDEDSPDTRLGFCFDPATTVELANGKMIAVEYLSLGDEVVSCKSTKFGICENNHFDQVTDVTVIEEGGPFPAHTLMFENMKQINVTSPHLMYIYKQTTGKLMTTAAKDVKPNDFMMFQDGSLSKVMQVVDFDLSKKVSVNTVGGSFYANGVLTSGMCESYNSEDMLDITAEKALKSYAESHDKLSDCILTAKVSSPEAVLDSCLTQLS